MTKIAAVAFGLLIAALAVAPVVTLGADVGSGFAIYFGLVGAFAGAAELVRARYQRAALPAPVNGYSDDSAVDVSSVIPAMAGPSSDADGRSPSEDVAAETPEGSREATPR